MKSLKCSWNYSRRIFGIPFGTRVCPLYAASGVFFGEMERDETRKHISARPTRKAAHIGPFRRNAERAAVYPATKIKHRIVPIFPLPWYFTYLRWDTGEIPSRNTPALSCGFTRLPENTAAEREGKRERASGFSTKASRKIYERYRLLSFLNPGCALSRKGETPSSSAEGSTFLRNR